VTHDQIHHPPVLRCLSNIHRPCSAIGSRKTSLAYINSIWTPPWQLLIGSVNINSGTLNIAGVKKVGEMYAKEAGEAGFYYRNGSMSPIAPRQALVATIRVKSKKLFLIGHLDTVFELIFRGSLHRAERSMARGRVSMI